MKAISLLCSIVFLTACVSLSISDDQYQSASSGVTGCAPKDITIKDQVKTLKPGVIPTWTAVCNGEEYRCSGTQIVQCTKAK